MNIQLHIRLGLLKAYRDRTLKFSSQRKPAMPGPSKEDFPSCSSAEPTYETREPKFARHDRGASHSGSGNSPRTTVSASAHNTVPRSSKGETSPYSSAEPTYEIREPKFARHDRGPSHSSSGHSPRTTVSGSAHSTVPRSSKGETSPYSSVGPFYEVREPKFAWHDRVTSHSSSGYGPRTTDSGSTHTTRRK